MKVAVLPLDIVWGDREQNLRNIDRFFNGLDKDTDVVVLPEMFSTGYSQDPAVMNDLAEDNDGPSMRFIAGLAARRGCAIAGSFFARGDDGNFYNRAFFIEPDGEKTFYDKRHLFSISLESQLYSPGVKRPPVVRFRGWNISFIVCYDLRFPVWCRNYGQRYDMMLVPANWPTVREYAWQHLLIARAIENQAVYVGADRSGKDDFGTYDGMSFVADAMGKASHTENRNGFVYAVFDRDDLQKIRQRLPFWKDADDFSITGF